MLSRKAATAPQKVGGHQQVTGQMVFRLGQHRVQPLPQRILMRIWQAILSSVVLWVGCLWFPVFAVSPDCESLGLFPSLHLTSSKLDNRLVE